MHSHNIGATAPGLAVPDAASTSRLSSEIEDASPVTSGQGVKDQVEQDKSDSAIEDASRKALSTLQAELALRGFTLRWSNADDGTVRFYVGRWNLSRELPDLSAVIDFAEQVGVPNAS
ncbi:MAG: hypothetical protein H0W48_06020 [Methylibium sp.]|nr:hypothetical protein [Methylibium sp.]